MLYDRLIEDAEALRELLDEHNANLHSGRLALADPIAATSSSSAKIAHAFTAADIMKPGRVKHSRYDTRSPEENRQYALETLARVGDWMYPRFYAQQHYDSEAAARYFGGVLCKFCADLHKEGLVERRVNSTRGARYQYRIRKEVAAQYLRPTRAFPDEPPGSYNDGEG